LKNVENVFALDKKRWYDVSLAFIFRVVLFLRVLPRFKGE